MRLFRYNVLWMSLLFILFSFLYSIPVTAAQEAPILVPISAKILSGNESPQILLDRVRSTKWHCTDGNASFFLSEPAAALYLEWDHAPQNWICKTGDIRMRAGEDAFLHQFIQLPTPSREIEISWQGEATLCNLYFLGEGSLPDWIQLWKPPCQKADFLLLPTHADDEHLWFGGVMPLYAGEMGLAVQVAYMVNHNTEPYRMHEQLDGLWTVGVRNYPIIPDFPDLYSPSLEHAQKIYNEDEIIAYQVELIRRFCPSVIVGHDIKGEYGHGAHCLNADALTQAVQLAAQDSYRTDSDLPAWDTPKTYLHLYPENSITMDWDQPLEAFDGKTAFEMAKKGFSCHTSQSTYFIVEKSGPLDCRKFGLYRSTVGPDTTADMMQNLPNPVLDIPGEATDLSDSKIESEPETTPISIPSEPSALTNNEFETLVEFISWMIVGMAAILILTSILLTLCRRK
jgi:LmbE family N-acetylglucosaminyl deacetylase